MRPITGDSSKALLPVGGITLLERILNTLPLELKSIVVTSNKRDQKGFTDTLHRWGMETWRPRGSVSQYVEDTETLAESPGTIGSLEKLIHDWGLDDDLLVVAADNFLGVSTLDGFANAFDGNTMQIAVEEEYDLNRVLRHGVVRMEGKWVKEFIEKPKSDPFPNDPAPRYVAPFCYIIPRRLLPLVKHSTVEGMGEPGKKPRGGDFITKMLELGEEVRGYRFYSEWIRMTCPEDYEKIRNMLERR